MNSEKIEIHVMWNASLMKQGNFIDMFVARHVLGYIRPSSGALDVELQHMVFCTEFLDGFRKPYAATQYLMLLMMGVCTRNMWS